MEEKRIENPDRLRIASMTRENIPVVAELERKNFSIPWSEQSFLNVLDDEFSFSYVGVLEGRIIAYTIFGAIDDYAELWNIAVDERARRTGIGESMLHFVIDQCREMGVASLFLQVRESNHPAISLYEKNGFTFVMVQKDYYHSPQEGALVYRLDILR